MLRFADDERGLAFPKFRRSGPGSNPRCPRIRDNRWPIQATIEFEYKFPASSDRMTELARAIKFCRDALA